MNDEIFRMKEIYNIWQSAELLTEFGPLRAPKEFHKMNDIWRNEIDPAILRINKTQEKLNDGTFLVKADSPWHAYFYLRAEQQYAYRGGRLMGTPIMENRGNKLGEHLFFRGQRCASWDIISSLHRKKDQDQKIENQTVQFLREYFALFLPTKHNFDSLLARVFAQHYGVATDLLDITCDPDIAIWFASNPIDYSCNTENSDSAVLAFSWAGQKDRSEAKFILPPPFVKNLYTQRGLFIDVERTDGRVDSKLSLRIEFPADTVGGEFKIIRDGQHLNVWPENDQDESELIRWARNLALNNLHVSDHKLVITKLRQSGGLPTYWLEKSLYDLDVYWKDWFSILDWILPATCITAVPAPKTLRVPYQFEINPSKLIDLINENRFFFELYLEMMENFHFGNMEYLEMIYRVIKNIMIDINQNRQS